MAKTLTKGLLGRDDLSLGATGTFARTTSTGGSQNISRIMGILDNVRVVGQGTLTTLQAAIDDLVTGESPGAVFIPPGSYNISSSLLFNENNIWVFGAGRRNTIINCTNAAVDAVQITGSSVWLSGVEIRYSSAANSGTYGLRMTNASNCLVENIYFRDANAFNGVLVETTSAATSSSQENHLRRVFVDDCQGTGLTLSGNATGIKRLINSHITGCRFANGNTTGLLINDWVQGVFVEDSRFEINGRNININPTATSQSFDIFFRNCILDNAQTNENLRAVKTTRVFFIGGWSATTTGANYNILFDQDVTNSEVKNSFISYGAGGEISDDGDNNVFYGNTLLATGTPPTNAILIGSNASGTTVADNSFRGGYTNDVNNGGTNSHVGINHSSLRAGKLVIGPTTGTTSDLNFDANDEVTYDRTNNQWNFNIGGTTRMALSLATGTNRLKVNVPVVYANIPTFTNADTTPSVQGGNVFKTNNSGATTITAFTNGLEGQLITVIFTDANTTLSDAGTLKLAGAFTSTADDVMQLVFDGTNWYEVSRSVN